MSNLARPGSGHWYFSLKDEAAQVRCAMFRNRNMLVKAKPDRAASFPARVPSLAHSCEYCRPTIIAVNEGIRA